MTTTDKNIKKLEDAGLFDSNSDYDGLIGKWVKELLLTFQKQGHSGMSAEITATVFHKLIMGESLSPEAPEADNDKS